jgi:DNA ligase (NAD+)
LENLRKASFEELEALPDIGKVVAKSVYNWFRDKQNLKLLEGLKKAGVKILPPKKIGTKLKGKTFVITGVLDSMSRFEAQKKIRLLGGHPTNSISKKTDYLVVGKNPGSKLEKAKKLGVKIINEKEFLELIKQ